MVLNKQPKNNILHSSFENVGNNENNEVMKPLVTVKKN